MSADFRNWRAKLHQIRSQILRRPDISYEHSVDTGTTVPSIEKVQRLYLQLLRRLEKTLPLRFILVDPYTEPSPLFWAVSTEDFRQSPSAASILGEIARIDPEIAVAFGPRMKGRRVPVALKFERASSLANVRRMRIFKNYTAGARLIHGPWSGVRIEFPAIDGDQLQGRTYCFVQRSINLSTLEDLPSISLLGESFATTPALSKVWRSNVIPEQVDLVYTWVDGRDPEWIERRKNALLSTNLEKSTQDATIGARYHQRNELLYSVRSALTYFRGINKVYVVTDRQKPILDDDPRISILDHRDIFKDRSNLPTFNSHAIESQLHRIPGLLDRYIYLNDDVFFARAVTPYLFYDEYGRSRYFVSDAVTIPEGPPLETDAGVDVAAKNARDLLHREFGICVTQKFKHTPIALDRRIIVEMERRFPDVFKETSASKFRSTHDFAVSGSFFFHYTALTGRAVPGSIKYDYFNLNSPEFQSQFQRIKSNLEPDRHDAFCVNDVDDSPHTTENERLFDHIIKSCFPLPVEN
jgi:hypothetical protein